MPLFEFACKSCGFRFEEIVSSKDVAPDPCRQCGKRDAEKLISRFAVGGQGDLRESTMHGCHEAHVGPSHDHSHED